MCILALIKEQEQQWRTILFYVSLIDTIALIALAAINSIIVIFAVGFGPFLVTLIIYALTCLISAFWTYMFYYWMKELNESGM